MKIVFMGTPDIAVPILRRIIDDGHEVLACVTQPDRPRGRGKKMSFSPVKEEAIKNGIEVLQPEKASDEEFLSRIRELSPDLCVVVAFGQILRKNLLDIPRYGCINVHVSLLPKLRGAAPINWAIINGDKKTGVTTMYMDEGLDTGDIILTKEFDLDDEITAGELHDQMMIDGAEVLSKTLKLVESGEIKRKPQNHEESTYAPMLDKSIAHVDFMKSARDTHNLIRGVNPWPVAWCETARGKMKIFKTRVLSEDKKVDIGKVIDVSKDGITIGCNPGVLLIEEIQMPNKKRMKVVEYIKGKKIEIGEIFE